MRNQELNECHAPISSAISICGHGMQVHRQVRQQVHWQVPVAYIDAYFRQLGMLQYRLYVIMMTTILFSISNIPPHWQIIIFTI